jgi:signal transduction histidine kinase
MRLFSFDSHLIKGIYLITALLFSGLLTHGQNGQIQTEIQQQAAVASEGVSNAVIYEKLVRDHRSELQLQQREQDSILNAVKKKITAEKNRLSADIKSLESTAAALREGNDDIQKANNMLTLQTVLFFGILIALLVIILLRQKAMVSRAQSSLERNRNILQQIELQAEQESAARQQLASIKGLLPGLMSRMETAENLLAGIASDKNHALFNDARNLSGAATGLSELVESALSEGDHHKSLTNLNELIREATGQAYHGMQLSIPEFHVKVELDLEKILPETEVNRSDIRFVLFNLLTNAFISVWHKRSNSPKGYQPTVTVSSRKLPRFIQIRVKDNGAGIPEKQHKRLFTPFYKGPDSKGAGLGLSESLEIIKSKHKGELFLESTVTNSTDFVIRFPLQVIM